MDPRTGAGCDGYGQPAPGDRESGRTGVSRGNRPIVVPLHVIVCYLVTFCCLLAGSITSSCSTWALVRLHVLPS